MAGSSPRRRGFPTIGPDCENGNWAAGRLRGVPGHFVGRLVCPRSIPARAGRNRPVRPRYQAALGSTPARAGRNGFTPRFTVNSTVDPRQCRAQFVRGHSACSASAVFCAASYQPRSSGGSCKPMFSPVVHRWFIPARAGQPKEDYRRRMVDCRSIPARAGHPCSVISAVFLLGLIPARAGHPGGWRRPNDEIAGRSPRGRGIPVCVSLSWRSSRSIPARVGHPLAEDTDGSIPARAGSRSSRSSRRETSGVHPRPCGPLRPR